MPQDPEQTLSPWRSRLERAAEWAHQHPRLAAALLGAIGGSILAGILLAAILT